MHHVFYEYNASTIDSIVRVYKYTEQELLEQFALWVSIKYNDQDTNRLCRTTQIVDNLWKNCVDNSN